VSDELRLERLPSDGPEQAICFLCDDFFLPGGILATLYDGRLPLGHICAVCAAGPRQAAARVRQRAKRILSLLKDGVDDSSAELSLRRRQLIRLRADFWKALARRIEKSDAWQ